MQKQEAIAEQLKWIKERYESATNESTKAYLRGYEAGVHFVIDGLYVSIRKEVY